MYVSTCLGMYVCTYRESNEGSRGVRNVLNMSGSRGQECVKYGHIPGENGLGRNVAPPRGGAIL